jgi:N-acetylglutamate synthase-like GNAT family acetyltransferase
MITYQVEKYHEIKEEIHALWQSHWEEVALDKAAIPLEPNYEMYQQLSEMEVLHLVTVREDGNVIGYHISMIHGHLHYKSSKTCFTDIFFVVKEKRKGFVGIKLLKFMEQSVKDLGVQKIYMGCKTHIDITPVLEHLGYKHIEKIFTKVL